MNVFTMLWCLYVICFNCKTDICWHSMYGYDHLGVMRTIVILLKVTVFYTVTYCWYGNFNHRNVSSAGGFDCSFLFSFLQVGCKLTIDGLKVQNHKCMLHQLQPLQTTNTSTASHSSFLHEGLFVPLNVR